MNNNKVKLTRSPKMQLLYQGITYVFEDMDRTQLMELRELLQDDLDGINSQLDAARANVIKRGEYADADWYNSAIMAKKFRGRAIQAIQIELGKRNKDRSHDRPLSEYFVDVAKEVLVHETWGEIMDEAEFRKAHSDD